MKTKKKSSQKFWVNYYDGADYTVALEPDYGGACRSYDTFKEAKMEAIGDVLSDLMELKNTLQMLRSLKKKDLFKSQGEE
jgi:hypothetical protein